MNDRAIGIVTALFIVLILALGGFGIYEILHQPTTVCINEKCCTVHGSGSCTPR